MNLTDEYANILLLIQLLYRSEIIQNKNWKEYRKKDTVVTLVVQVRKFWNIKL